MIVTDDKKVNTDSQLEELASYAVTKGLALGADEVEVKIDICNYNSVKVRNSEREDAEYRKNINFLINVCCDGKSGMSSTTGLTKEDINAAVSGAIDVAAHTTVDPFAGLPNKEDLAWEIEDLELYHPQNFDFETETKKAYDLEARIKGYHPQITQSLGVTYSYALDHEIIANSYGFLKSLKSTTFAVNLALIAERDSKIERGFSYSRSVNSSNLLDGDDLLKESLKHALEYFGCKRLKTGKYSVILRHDVAIQFIFQFISGLFGSTQYLKNSFLLDSINTQIAPSWFSLIFDPSIKQNIFSYALDAEGVKPRKESIIENGVVKNYLLDSYSARKLNMQTNGHAGCIGKGFVFDREHQIRDLPSLCNMMNNGVIISNIMGQGFNSVTGDFSFGARGFLVQNGEIIYPVEGITIAGNIKSLFKDKLVAITEEYDDRHSINVGSMLFSEITIAGD